MPLQARSLEDPHISQITVDCSTLSFKTQLFSYVHMFSSFHPIMDAASMDHAWTYISMGSIA